MQQLLGKITNPISLIKERGKRKRKRIEEKRNGEDTIFSLFLRGYEPYVQPRT